MLHLPESALLLVGNIFPHLRFRAPKLGASRLASPNLSLPATGKLLACVRAVVVFTGFVQYLGFVPISFPAPERRVRLVRRSDACVAGITLFLSTFFAEKFAMRLPIMVIGVCLLFSHLVFAAQNLNSRDSLEMQKSENLDANSRQNKRQFGFGATFDIGPTFHVFSSRPFLLSGADFNFIGFDSELKFNAFACSYSMFVDYIEGDNVIRGGLGFKADYGTYEWREPTRLFITNMAGNQVEVNLPIKRELYYSASSFVVGAGFKRKLFGALYGEIAVEASFVLERNFQYREYVSNFLPEEYDGSLPGLQGHFHGIAGISYDIPCRINKETAYIFAPFIRYYYALSSIHTIANWKISRIGFGVEIRF